MVQGNILSCSLNLLEVYHECHSHATRLIVYTLSHTIYFIADSEWPSSMWLSKQLCDCEVPEKRI